MTMTEMHLAKFASMKVILCSQLHEEMCMELTSATWPKNDIDNEQENLNLTKLPFANNAKLKSDEMLFLLQGV